MSKRLNNPDTQADEAIRDCIEATPPQSFVVRAGAGSGKTTSLIKALHRVLETHGHNLRRKKQQVACITYTDLAAGEIRADVNEDLRVHVSTIHSFYWTIVKSFQSDIKVWVRQRIGEKLSELKDAADAFTTRTRPTTRDKNKSDVTRYAAQRDRLDKVTAFAYGTGSDYAKGILGHDDIIKVTNFLLHERPLFRRLVGLRFPFVFIDESQDTMDDVVESFKRVEIEMRGQFCLGFFGDPMQKIYLTGIGAITPAEHWREIDKPENYRCATRILDVANAVRAKGDGLKQTGGRTEKIDGVDRPVEGSARMFVLPSSINRREALAQVRRWTAQANHDEQWQDTAEGAAKTLVIVHRTAAQQLGFGDIYAALNDRASAALKQGFQEGTAWPLQPFVSYLLPLVSAMQQGQEFEAMNLLRANSPRLNRDALKGIDVARRLRELRGAVLRLMELMDRGGGRIRDVLRHAQTTGLTALDDRYVRRLELAELADSLGMEAALAAHSEAANRSAHDGERDDENKDADSRKSDDAPVLAFLACAASELWPYQTYINDESAFATQHGVKGDEFERVMVVMDDAGSNFSLYSYEKYFGIVPFSENDVQNAEQGLDDALSRTRRLFYVCCTRAKHDLVLVLFTEDTATARDRVIDTGILGEEFVLGPEAFDDIPV